VLNSERKEERRGKRGEKRELKNVTEKLTRGKKGKIDDTFKIFIGKEKRISSIKYFSEKEEKKKTKFNVPSGEKGDKGRCLPIPRKIQLISGLLKEKGGGGRGEERAVRDGGKGTEGEEELLGLMKRKQACCGFPCGGGRRGRKKRRGERGFFCRKEGGGGGARRGSFCIR